MTMRMGDSASERGVVRLVSMIFTVLVGLSTIAGCGLAYFVFFGQSDGSDEQISTLFPVTEASLLTPIPRSTATSSVHSTEPTAPTPTPRPTESPEPTATAVPPTATQAQVMSGVTMDIAPSQSTQSGQGLLSVSFAGTTEPISGLYVEVYSSALNVLQAPTAGERVESGRTGSTGSVVFDLAPGEYVVIADLRGYSWGTLTTGEGMANVIVQDGHSTNLSVRLGRLIVTAASVDQAISGQYVEVYTQRPDANGNWVPGDRVDSGRTDNTGSISFNLTQGQYIVVSDYRGYNWGNASGAEGEADIAVQPGEETVVTVRLGRVVATVRDAEGAAASDAYLELHTQVLDATGKLAPGERVDSGRTDNTGIWRADVTPGTYCVQFDGTTTCDVFVEAGSLSQLELREQED